MLTKKDRQLLIQDFKEVFATKDDLKGLVTKENAERFTTKGDLKNELSSMKTSLKKIEKKLITTIRFFDKYILCHEKRITKMEDRFKLPLAEPIY